MGVYKDDRRQEAGTGLSFNPTTCKTLEFRVGRLNDVHALTGF